MTNKNIKFSIIIRTFNEERWLPHCLNAIFSQSIKNFEIIIVDNYSNDNSISIAKRYNLKKIYKIKKFLPGKALNIGIKKAVGEFIVCLSAHCIPKNNKWLENLFLNFKDDSVAAVYGKQLPLPFTSDSDKRDLVIAFGDDKKFQKKDYFFHNANSMIRKTLWNKFNFDNNATNIEDRIWAKQIINSNYQIVYEPDASVYHYHGLHQHEDSSKRAQGIARILDNLHNENFNKLPNFLNPENNNFIAVVPIIGNIKKIKQFNLLKLCLDQLETSKYIKNIFILSDNNEVYDFISGVNINVIQRPNNLKSRNISLEKIMKYALDKIESLKMYPDALLYVNYLYPIRPSNLFDDLILELQYEGLDSVFSSYVDYGNFWIKNSKNKYEQIGDPLAPRLKKNPFHRALYGLGCLTHSSIIRQSRLVGENVGILPLNNIAYALRADSETPNNILLSLLEKNEKK